jgi:hypothetical protein
LDRFRRRRLASLRMFLRAELVLGIVSQIPRTKINHVLVRKPSPSAFEIEFQPFFGLNRPRSPPGEELAIIIVNLSDCQPDSQANSDVLLKWADFSPNDLRKLPRINGTDGDFRLWLL